MSKRTVIAAILLKSMVVCALYAQNYSAPLTMEGLDHTSDPSVLSKAMGGASLTLKNDVSLMFANPASLNTLDRLTISVGSAQAMTNANQTQQWYPLFSFGSFSTLMDGSTRGIVPVGVATSPADTNWVPFDNIVPNWSHKNNSDIVPNIFVGMPFKIGNVKLAAGLGYSEYANMTHFYENNNDLSPEYDLVLIGNPADTRDSVQRINWFETVHARTGSLHSMGGALSADVNDNLSIGVSGRAIAGSTNDFDMNYGRGVLWFYSAGKAQKIWPAATSNVMRVDTATYNKMISGTSDYSGFELNVSTQYRTKNVTLGASVTIPTTITRDFSGQVLSDTVKHNVYAASYSQVDTSYSEKMHLPIKAKVGIGLQLRPNVFLAAEYDYLPYGSAKLDAAGATTKPWLDGTGFHIGIAWEPINILSLRFGYRRQKEVFAAQYTAYTGDPIAYNAYSAGAGVQLMPNLNLNVAYEFYEMKYEDTWAQSYNINILRSNFFSASLSYALNALK